ncbi:single-stranded DNA-binding protein [Desulfobulbus alkaliphilus]|uniref:single-stranded DNA-binding protein n=1 Tax=Desulfobulbus alkaliphilus TaxID=869814 RepID=UPI001962D895|nr:single-stranded DNA-binding protein [Desulfobulbus alkaliphilus]MBM9536170.1 single-stranded DNA-binding protein [Desulfobulbus alkaliphilus]
MADYDINQARITGGVEKFDHINTRTGTPMIKALVRCYRETVSVVAFKELAENTDLAPGDRVDVRGKIQSTSWTAQDGSKRYGWQLIADHIDLIGDPLAESQATGEPQLPAPAPPSTRPASPARKNETQHRMFNPDEPGPYDYQGGPF